MIKKIGKIAVSAILSALLLTSCKVSGEPVLTYGDTVINENFFTYYLATYKSSFLSTYADMEDTKEFYDLKLPNGQTGEEFLFDQTVNNVSMSLICAELFDKAGLTLSSAVTKTIDSYIDSFINDYAEGDKRFLNSKLSEYGINIKMLREIYLLEEKGTALYEYLYGDNGTIGVTEEELDAYYRENYVRVRHIYVNNKYYYETTEEGYNRYDENGNLITHAYEGEALEAKNAVIASIDAAIEAGTDFEEIYKLYSEDQYYENGYYLTAGMDFIDEVEISAFELEVDEIKKVESDHGVHYIKRLAFDEKPWEDEDNADFFEPFLENVRFKAFVAYVEQYLDDVVVNEDKLAEFSIRESPVNSRF